MAERNIPRYLARRLGHVGNIIRYQGTLVDITEKRKMERQLAAAGRVPAALLESFPDLILVLDLEGRYTFVSSRARDLLGYGPEDMLGKKISDLEDHSPELAVPLPHSGFRQAGVRAQRNMGPGTATATGARCGPRQPAAGCGGKISRRHHFGPRHDHREESWSSRSSRASAGGHGRDDRRLRARTEQSADQHSGRERTAAGTETNEAARKQLAMLQQQARRAAEIVQNLTYFARPPAPGRARINLTKSWSAP